MKYHVDLHAIVKATITVGRHQLAHILKDTLQNEIPELGHVLIHVEPDDE
jgi:divalent metal cation (Fe/Co/Zn/Cd) transporter